MKKKFDWLFLMVVVYAGLTETIQELCRVMIICDRNLVKVLLKNQEILQSGLGSIGRYD